MFSKLTIRARLIFVISFLALMLVGSGVLGLVGLRSTNAQMRSLYEDRLVAFSQLERMSAAEVERRSAEADAWFDALDKYES